MVKITGRYLMFVIIALSVGCSDDASEQTQSQSLKTVKTQVVGQPDLNTARSYPGVVDATQKVEMAFQVPGPLVEFPVKPGDIVEEGQLLARIDPRDYQHNLDKAVADYENAKVEYIRFKELVRTGSVSRSQFDEKQAQYKITSAQKNTTQKALDDTYMHAPFAGVISNTFVENFEHVKAKEKILNLHDVSEIEIIIDVPEWEFFHLNPQGEKLPERKGQTVGVVMFESLPDKTFPVKVKEFKTEADPVTQTYQVTLAMKNLDDYTILPGMTATAIPVDDDIEGDSFNIPTTAVVNDENNQQYVWVVDMDKMIVNKQPVTTKKMQDGTITVTSGLKSGDRIVVAGAHFLFDNEKVRLYEPKSERSQ